MIGIRYSKSYKIQLFRPQTQILVVFPDNLMVERD